MKKWYNSLDAYVHWSDGEVVSRSILEAMEYKKLIFASDIPSTKEQLLYGSNCGILFKNEPDFLSKFNKYFYNKKKITSLKNNCHLQLLKKYNLKIFIKKMNNLLRDFEK